ncbi:MAG: hypothetical protein HZA18_05675 [Nitrospirae bacterium]|nr:hypothetical protein [Nitrospirota bacterium]
MDKNDLLLEQWKMAVEMHRHMDNMARQAFNYFIVTNGVLIAALATIINSDAFKEKNLFTLIITFAIPFIGFFVSLIWGLIQKREQLYQYYRAKQAERTEDTLRIDGERVLTLFEKTINEQTLIQDWYLLTRLGKWRTHSLMLRVPQFFTCGWLLLFISLFAYTLCA